MKFLIPFLLSFFSIAYAPLVAQQISAEGPFDQLIIRGVTLINGNGAPPIGPVDVVVEQNIITQVRVVGYPGIEINDRRRPELQIGGKEIDAHGMYLLPGFIDMHGHIGGTSQGADWDYVFKLWLAHGVTTVREPSGRSRSWTLDLKKKSEEKYGILSVEGFEPLKKLMNDKKFSYVIYVLLLLVLVFLLSSAKNILFV